MATLSLSERETQFFQDLYLLMQSKYPEMSEKFGVWRAHQHFKLGEGEVFHETSNRETKESVLKIIKKTDLPTQAFASTWTLSASGPVVATWCCDDRMP
ncbi:MAG: hypothetical protein JSR80_01330 [Verrucomicrobia bacterium]|nr:hypothetical protein [Verrucomicrobiota bacterium]